MKALHIAIALLGMTSPLANAQARPAKLQFPVPPSSVANAVIASLAAKGIKVTAEQIKLPSNILVNEENPLLEVSAIERLGRLITSQPGQTSASIKLKCTVATACRPFFAIATWTEEKQVPVAVSKAPVAEGKIVAVTEALAKPAMEKPAGPFIKAGQPLTLIMDGDHMRIQIAVVSLASASPGQKIRVSTPDHKHVYMAEVLDAGTVKGSL